MSVILLVVVVLNCFPNFFGLEKVAKFSVFDVVIWSNWIHVDFIDSYLLFFKMLGEIWRLALFWSLSRLVYYIYKDAVTSVMEVHSCWKVAEKYYFGGWGGGWGRGGLVLNVMCVWLHCLNLIIYILYIYVWFPSSQSDTCFLGFSCLSLIHV